MSVFINEVWCIQGEALRYVSRVLMFWMSLWMNVQNFCQSGRVIENRDKDAVGFRCDFYVKCGFVCLFEYTPQPLEIYKW